MVSKATKLLKSMRRNKAGWKRKDIDTLLIGFGFIIKHGKRHDIAVHPEFPSLRQTLPRHGKELLKPYISHAVKMVERAQELRSQGE